jgi:hypothetical protein
MNIFKALTFSSLAQICAGVFLRSTKVRGAGRQTDRQIDRQTDNRRIYWDRIYCFVGKKEYLLL